MVSHGLISANPQINHTFGLSDKARRNLCSSLRTIKFYATFCRLALELFRVNFISAICVSVNLGTVLSLQLVDYSKLQS